jgi:hypothetical protein
MHVLRNIGLESSTLAHGNEAIDAREQSINPFIRINYYKYSLSDKSVGLEYSRYQGFDKN